MTATDPATKHTNCPGGLDLPRDVWQPRWGHAIDDCSEDSKGRLIVGNSEYSSPVNFCPFCGFRGTPWT